MRIGSPPSQAQQFEAPATDPRAPGTPSEGAGVAPGLQAYAPVVSDESVRVLRGGRGTAEELLGGLNSGGPTGGDPAGGPAGGPALLGLLPRLPLAPKDVVDNAAKAAGEAKKAAGAGAGGAAGAAQVAADAAKLAKLSPQKRLDYLEQLRQKSPDKFDALVDAVRAGTIKDPAVALPVAIELASSTAWGKTAEGKDVLANLRAMYAQGKVAFGPVPGDNMGFTKPDKAADGMAGGKGTGSKIILNDKLLGTPEGLASVLAHEGLHAYRYAKGQNQPSALDSETEANLVGMKVWAEFGPGKAKAAGKDAQAMVKQLDDDGTNFDPKKPAAENERRVRLNVATQYAYNYATAHDRSRYAEGAAMIEQALGGPDTKDILKSASDSQIKRLFSAYSTFMQDKSTPRSANAQAYFAMLLEQMDKRNLWTSK